MTVYTEPAHKRQKSYSIYSADDRLNTPKLLYTNTAARRKFGAGKRSINLEMWASAQRDGRPAEYRWRPLFNAAKFG